MLNALPRSARPAATKALAEIYAAEDKTHAASAARAFATEFGARWPKAAAKFIDDLDALLGFYDYPAEHWITYGPSTRSSRPSPPSGCASARHHRPRLRAAGIAMAFKLIEASQQRWRTVNAPHLVAFVRAGALFVNGQLVEPNHNEDQQEETQQAA